MSDAARMLILKQLNNGQLSAEQAADLLRALGDDAKTVTTTSGKGNLPAKPEKPKRKLTIKLAGRAIKNGPHSFTLSLAFLNTIRSFTDMIPAVRNLIMWDALNLIGGELAQITFSID